MAYFRVLYLLQGVYLFKTPRGFFDFPRTYPSWSISAESPRTSIPLSPSNLELSQNPQNHRGRWWIPCFRILHDFLLGVPWREVNPKRPLLWWNLLGQSVFSIPNMIRFNQLYAYKLDTYIDSTYQLNGDIYSMLIQWPTLKLKKDRHPCWNLIT